MIFGTFLYIIYFSYKLFEIEIEKQAADTKRNGEQMVGKKKATFGEKVVGAFLAGAAHAGVVFYGRELAGIAKASGTRLPLPILLYAAH